MEKIITELAGIFYGSNFPKARIMEMFYEEWTNETDEGIEYYSRAVVRTINAIRFLKKRFPVGLISPEKIQELSGVPFDTETLEAAARIVNKRKDRRTRNILAFPKLPEKLPRQFPVKNLPAVNRRD